MLRSVFGLTPASTSVMYQTVHLEGLFVDVTGGVVNPLAETHME